MRIVIFANTVYTDTLTGGDRIFAELAKKWIEWGHEVTITTNKAGIKFCLKVGVSEDNIVLWPNSWADKFGVYFSMLIKAVVCIFQSTFFNKKADIILASSFFVPDSIPGLILKSRNKNATFAIAAYLFSSKTWGRDYSGGELKGLFFYVNEIIAFWITKVTKGKILTASSYDRNMLIETQKFEPDQVLAIRGGVDNEFFASIPEQAIEYDAVFVGRLHPQKCVDELIEIWEMILQKSSGRKLAIIGNGPLEWELKQLVINKRLNENIEFLGALDGLEKTKVIKSSRIFVSASKYDSGNIALDEALSCGVPGVAYNLPRLDYPLGVIRIPVGNKDLFVDQVLKLFRDKRRHKTLSNRAIAFALKLDWNQKAKEVLDYLCTELMDHS